jgi:hypothetical protein
MDMSKHTFNILLLVINITILKADELSVLGEFQDPTFKSVNQQDNSSTQTEILTPSILPSNSVINDRFGSSVSSSGLRVAVGSRYDSDEATFAGAVYIFDYIGSTWVETKKITIPGVQQFSLFGHKVSIDGDRLAIGAPYDESKDYDGTVYIFEFNGFDWIQTQLIYPDLIDKGYEFGYSLKLKGDQLIIGTPFGNGAANNSGFVDFYEYDGVNWIKTQRIFPVDGEEGDRFGTDVDFSSNKIIVSSSFDDDVGLDAGSAYIFEKLDSSWIQTMKLLPQNPSIRMYFGLSVKVIDDFVLVGAIGDCDIGFGFVPGNVQVFEKSNLNWNLHEIIEPSDAVNCQKFGWSIDNYKDRLIIGAAGLPGSDLPRGSAYQYILKNNNWLERKKYRALNEESHRYFGHSVAITNEYVFMGVDNDSLRDQGAVFVSNYDIIFDNGFN